MDFEWEEAKNQENIRRHRVDFNDAKEIFYGDTVERVDRRPYGEIRYNALGMYRGHVLHVTYTIRGQYYRLISARKAERHERRAYYKRIFG